MNMDIECSGRIWQVLVICNVFAVCLVTGQVTYSIPEEMSTGSLVGNLAQDLGLDPKRFRTGKARIYKRDNGEYIDLDKDRGLLLIRERIDREALCGQTTPCALHFQVILENPMEFYTVTIEITDINDNPPQFEKEEMGFRISESATNGAKFVLERAMDLDVGVNGLQGYSLSPSEHFTLKLLPQTDGSKNVEMVLQKPLDRETQNQISIILTAVDGGDPQLSGTAQIRISVLDVNDNAPAFTQSTYKAVITENAPKGTLVTTVSASDLDEGLNGNVTYLISNTLDNVRQIFGIHGQSGAVSLIGSVDYEKARHYQINVIATDQGGLTDSCKILVDVHDINDNAPSISVMSKSNVISEDSMLGTAVSILNVQDMDSSENGKVKCLISEGTPFALKTTSADFFSLVTDDELDRERDSEYNITVTCFDEGLPSLSSSVTLSLQISDVNDNAPVFEKSEYVASVSENNPPGLSVLTVRAKDADWNQNARVSYMLVESPINGVPVSSYISVNAESGVVHALRSFDFEQLKELKFHIKTQDGGSPALSSNVSVRILIQDQNDNAPQVLYPVQTSSSILAEIVPRSAETGYLVTKVVAVDVDSGQNAWLSYKLLKGIDRALFEVGAQNGEVRTVRQVTDKDAMKQKLIIVVEDNGKPSRSATVNVNVALADSFPEMLSEFSDFTHKDGNGNLTFYLVLALAVVSFLFIVSIIAILSVKCYRWKSERSLLKSGGQLPVIPYYPPLYSDTLDGTGTMERVYNYEICRTTDSRKSDLKFARSYTDSIISLDASRPPTLPCAEMETLVRDDCKEQV